MVCAAAAIVAFCVGFHVGKRYGRRQEAELWRQEVLPDVRRLEYERNLLWRSAVSKTQRLNRIRRGE